MYCGSCLRDNALAARLIKLGHDDPQPICQTGAPSIAHLDIMMP